MVHVMVLFFCSGQLYFVRIVSHLFKDARRIDVIGNIIMACCQMR